MLFVIWQLTTHVSSLRMEFTPSAVSVGKSLTREFTALPMPSYHPTRSVSSTIHRSIPTTGSPNAPMVPLAARRAFFWADGVGFGVGVQRLHGLMRDSMYCFVWFMYIWYNMYMIICIFIYKLYNGWSFHFMPYMGLFGAQTSQLCWLLTPKAHWRPSLSTHHGGRLCMYCFHSCIYFTCHMDPAVAS